VNFVGIVVTLVGVVFASLATSEAEKETAADTARRSFSWLTPGIAFAMGASFMLGVGFWAFRFVTPTLGSPVTVLVQRITALVFSVIYLRARNVATRLKSVSSLKWMLPMGAFDAAGYWFYNLGILSGLIAIVSVLTALFAIITMLWGYVISKERIAPIQWIGVAITLAGVALVSV
jgi:drug/metabolite transporter (DMT)-like permease